ncbi:MAG: hypothetical protein GY845_35300 [Planctomycetes bacterium]|nr:hypothetical protein [Planctomycetota bacterium]
MIQVQCLQGITKKKADSCHEKTNPIFPIFHLKTMISQKTNPIQTQFEKTLSLLLASSLFMADKTIKKAPGLRINSS